MEPKIVLSKLKELKTPEYRFKQALRAYYQELQGGWEDLSTWPRDLRESFSDVTWSPLKLEDVLESEGPHSFKMLFTTQDDLALESVVMRHEDGRNTVCVSSQIGCAMNCAFCATGKSGFTRNLTTEEIVDQVIQAGRWLKNLDGEARVTNIVFMGMGEPFNNPESVFEAIQKFTSPDMFGLGARHISVSTCGIIPGIKALIERAPQVNLAISLHAPTQLIREQIMPVAKAYPLEKLMRAVEFYMTETRRKVMFEYVLLEGINDGPEQAQALADLLEGHRHLAHVNLIKYHETGEFKSVNQTVMRQFANFLKRRGISVTTRVSFGEDIDAACGQLAARASKKHE